MSEVLMKIGGVPVYLDPDGSVHFVGEFTIDCDGCPMAYGPDGCLPEPYDYLANAGYPGNWWGIVTDEYGNPYEQKESDPRERAPYPGLYVSTTAYVNPGYDKYDVRRYVDSEKVKFCVIPSNVRMSVHPKVLGCRTVITDQLTGKTLECACCDIGPADHLGEAAWPQVSTSAWTLARSTAAVPTTIVSITASSPESPRQPSSSKANLFII